MYILVAQILVSLLLITVIILQSKSSGLGAAFGASTSYHTKRGVEKSLFYLTIFLSFVFITLAIVSSL